MQTELPVLKAVKTILAAGSYGMDIHGFYIDPDDLISGDEIKPAFATIGLSEDVERVYSYNTLSGAAQVEYTVAVKFFICKGEIMPSSGPFFDFEVKARAIIREAARLFFANEKLNGTVAESGDVTSSLVYPLFNTEPHTGVWVEMPITQEI